MMEELRALPGMELDGCGVAGIYFLFWGGRLEYVGKSVNVFSRIAVHWTNMRRKARGLKTYNSGMIEEAFVYFDEVRIKSVPEDELDLEELAAIQRYRPRVNVKMNRTPLMDASQIVGEDWFKNLEKIADEAKEPVRTRWHADRTKPRERRRYVPSAPRKLPPMRRKFDFGTLLNV